MRRQTSIVEHLNKFSELITEEQDVLTKWFKELIMKMRRELKDKIIPCPACPEIASQCPPNIVGHFLMAERAVQFNDEISRDVKDRLKNDYMALVRDIRWTPEADRQVEKNLWTLLVGEMVIDGFSLNDYENELSTCFDALVSRRSYVLCLMLWLFPEFATPERMNIVEGIVTNTRYSAPLLLQDRMLFWLAKCNQEKARGCETQICELQDSGAFAILKGNGVRDSLRSDAIGLLILTSCAKRNSDKPADEVVWQTVRRIVERLIGARLDDDKVCRYYDPDIGWVYDALCEYVNLIRRA